MKKLISIFGAMTLTATTAVMVVSCANMGNFNEIKNALDNEESMIILISAEDCSHCKNFKYEVNKYNNLPKGENEFETFDEMFTSITRDTYNQKINGANDVTEEEKTLTKYGEVVDKITFKEYEAETFENLFEEEWLVSLKDLIRDQLRELYKTVNEDTTDSDKKIDKKINQNYLNEIMTGTPTFLHFRNGRFIGTSAWDFKGTSEDNGTFRDNIESYVESSMFESKNEDKLGGDGVLWGDSNLSETFFNIIENGKPTPPTEGEGENPVDPE
ncbi:lipoprotein [Spiroplasma endosymbiont of Othius punctulatus]|uniref:lipoprotein n=1 Tax=Spiroplasma endosymbiont of Othius punctulatus TaxID=3066289 RepID=UPI0030CCB4C8